MIILSACDKAYLKHAIPLINSVARNTNHAIEFHMLPDIGRGPDWQKDYCANYRIDMLLEHHNGEENLLWLDADSLIRADISQLDRWLDEYDTAAVHTPEMGAPGTMNHWLISTVGVSKGAVGRQFLLDWKKKQEEVYREWCPSIMTCQYSWVQVIMQGKYRVKDITYNFSDKFFRDETPLWEGQGNRKYEDPRWLAETEKYR